MDNLKVEEYVRTNDGIFKVTKIDGLYIYLDKEYFDNQYQMMRDVTFKERIIKHSFNIIDLIEVGDIVKLDDEFIEYRLIDVFDESIIEGLKQDIKTGVKINSILTKEQYKRNCYTVEREKDENTEDIKKE